MRGNLLHACAVLGIQCARRNSTPERIATWTEYWLDRCYVWKQDQREKAVKIAMEMRK